MDFHLTVIGINILRFHFQELLQQTNPGHRGLGCHAPKDSHKSPPKMMMHRLIALEAYNKAFCLLPVSVHSLGMGPGIGTRELAKSQ